MFLIALDAPRQRITCLCLAIKLFKSGRACLLWVVGTNLCLHTELQANGSHQAVHKVVCPMMTLRMPQAGLLTAKVAFK